MQPTGRVAVITGAGSGIGRTVAKALSARGYRLVLAGRRLGKLQETASLTANPAAARPWQTDVCDARSVGALFEHAVDSFGRVDLLFNNAGTSAPAATIDEIVEADWRRVIEVNLTGAFLCLQAAFRTMRSQTPQGGRIINNGSLAAMVPRPESAGYAASKHAITGLTKATSLEGRKHNIACGQIDIGNAASEMATSAVSSALQADGTTRSEPLMGLNHVGEAVAFMDSLPLEANVQFMTIMATKMPFIGRG